MSTEYRGRLAIVALLGVAIGSAVTYGVEKLNAPKPVIIADAVNVPPQPTPVATPTTIASNKDVGKAAASAGRRKRHGASTTAAAKPKKITSGTIDINTASVEELEKLPGVGPSTAQNIVSYREQFGGFKSVEELGDIPRMGGKKLAKLTPFVSL